MIKSLIAITIVIGSGWACADASFNQVRDVIFTQPVATSEIEQQEINGYLNNTLPHYAVTSANFFKGGVNLLKKDAQRTLSDTADFYPRLEKRLHANGICFTGEWRINETTPYSGYFQKGTQGLLVARASVALSETERGEPRAFAFAGKLFPTMDPDMPVKTANFFTADVLAGTQREHYLDVKMTNKPKTGFRFSLIPLAFNVGRVFIFLDSQSGLRPVRNIASLGLTNGETITSPHYLMIQSSTKNQLNTEKDFRDELNIEKHYPQGLIFDILTSDTSGNQNARGWQKIGEITLNESKVSYGCDRRLHFAHPKVKTTH